MGLFLDLFLYQSSTYNYTLSCFCSGLVSCVVPEEHNPLEGKICVSCFFWNPSSAYRVCPAYVLWVLNQGLVIDPVSVDSRP